MIDKGGDMSESSKPAPSDEAADLPEAVNSPSESENIDKIRDILFGSQSRQIDKKLVALDDKIEKAIASVRIETKSNLDTLERFVRNELQSISDQLSSEKNERIESAQTLSEKVNDAKRMFENKLSLLGDKVVSNQREVQEQILQQAKTVMTEIREKNDALQKHLNQSIEALTHEKTDRLALADLMMEAAMRLKNEFHLPESE
jgi:hypothetical protein